MRREVIREAHPEGEGAGGAARACPRVRRRARRRASADEDDEPTSDDADARTPAGRAPRSGPCPSSCGPAELGEPRGRRGAPRARGPQEARARAPRPPSARDYTLPAHHDPDESSPTAAWTSQRLFEEAKTLQEQVRRVRRDGHAWWRSTRARGHHLRVQARRGHQVLEDRGPGRRPGAGPGGGVHPHRPHERPRHGGHRDPQRGARDDLAARDPGVATPSARPRAG